MRKFQAYLKSRATDEDAGYDQTIAVNALNAIIHKMPNTTPNTLVFGGNRVFSPKEKPVDLGEGVIALRGFYTSVRPTNSGALLNVHTRVSTFYEPVTVSNFMVKHGVEDSARLRAILNGVRVRTRYTKNHRTEAVVEKVKVR